MDRHTKTLDASAIDHWNSNEMLTLHFVVFGCLSDHGVDDFMRARMADGSTTFKEASYEATDKAIALLVRGDAFLKRDRMNNFFIELPSGVSVFP